ncbi:fluoride efflux transporter FluC [Trueperella bialowiezensis]|uniref:Fluoride-specific ion channel FluC n=1 Tax=Trueperella bialowiezensis TaxID=312285 RepID=A0A3S4X4L3_9ACTO|nr:CrcB family protein [Trueperella bialowiezensis]VEI12554.1 camphor resistance protein CrcB [Trueperella bialowiezensis]
MNGLLVGLGGALGAGARYLLTVGAAHPPVVTLLINVFGALALGFITDVLPERARLFVGTGVLGGFTTYSALAVDTVQMLNESVLLGFAYAVFTVIAGIAAALLGRLVAQLIRGGH